MTPPVDLPIEYDPRLIEEAVLLALRGAGQERDFRQERDRLYAIENGEAREAAFRQFHAAWFERLGLHEDVVQALRAHPLVVANAARYMVISAASGIEGGAELLVARAAGGVSEAGRCSVVIRLTPETLLRPTRLREFLGHELFHIADMLDPAFAYDPRLPSFALGPAHEGLVRDRYRVLWDAYIDGRLVRLGQAAAGVRAERLREFARTFPMLGERTEEAFDRFFEAAACRHVELMMCASDPGMVLARPSRGPHPGERCPLCGFPSHVFEPEPDRLPQAVQDAIKGDFREWDPGRGLCLQCADLYRSRLLSPLSDKRRGGS